MGENTKILVVDDDVAIVELAKRLLTAEQFNTETAHNADDTTRLLEKKKFDLVILDNYMPGTSGLELAKHIQEKNKSSEIVIMTGAPEKSIIDEFRRLGIVYFIFKPFHDAQLLYTVHAALYHARLKRSLAAKTSHATRSSGIIGISESSRFLRSEIQIFAGSSVPILVLGETGTGKEVIAREIHRFSPRKNASFVPVNCATLGTLANSQLFGHAKGAFTGAVRATKGFIGAANRGTLFLDEVGDLPLETQVNLLRFLDLGEYTTVGEETLRRADVRVICATNKNLRDGIKDNWFREDLFYRIAGSIIQTEPLRLHTEDIPYLVWHYLEKFGDDENRTYKISPHAIHALQQCSWPGNVRQLIQVLRVLTQRSAGKEISYSDVIKEIGPTDETRIATYREEKNEAIKQFDHEYFTRLLLIAEGSLKKILELSGMHKKNFYDKIKECGLSTKVYRNKKGSEKGDMNTNYEAESESFV